MRALFFGDSPQRIGGAQKSLLAALERLGDHGVEPIVAFPAAGPYEALCRARGLDVRVVESGDAFQRYGKALLGLGAANVLHVAATELAPTWARLARLADDVGAEVMHFNTPRGLVMAGPAAHLARRPCVMHLRGMPGLGRGVWLATQLLADRYVLVAEAMRPYFTESVQTRCRVVYNGIVPKPLMNKREARLAIASRLEREGRPLSSSSKLVVSLSAPVPFKGLHHLVEAAALLEAHGDDVVWLLAGAGLGDDYEHWLHERIGDLGLSERIHLLGHVDDVHALLSAADVFALTSITRETLTFRGTTLELGGTEGLPRSILESLAAGTPVVTTSGGGVREQVDEGRTGLVIEPSDPSALADAIAAVLGDPTWERVRELGPKVVRDRFSIDAAARGLSEVLREARGREGLVPRAIQRGHALVEVAQALRRGAA
jgi:glycosyltransferase involved in cell wall biosynthesis